MSATLLTPGQSRHVQVHARRGWTDTGVALEAGVHYAFTATGTWRDWRTVSGPAGYPSPNPLLRRAERWRRLPDAAWFALIGDIGGRRECRFLIGDAVELAPPRDGELRCAPNDVPLADFNNHGQILLSIERLS